MYVAAIMPFNIAFYDSEADTTWYYLDLFIDFTFIVDVMVNSFSAFYDDDGKLINNPRTIFCSYLKGWFFIDIIASFPFNLIEKEL